MKTNNSEIYFKTSIRNSFIIGRVTDILLDLSDENKIKKFSNFYPGNLSVGAIEFELINNINNISIGYCRPLFGNIKMYPVLNEMVLIFQGPSYINPDDSNAKELYYVSTYNTFNSPHINPQPIINGGEISNSVENNVIFGNTFIPKNIQSLLPFEGDVIFEGRWGNSLRFSSTISGSNKIYNEWSQEGIDGDPITIIRNGQTYNENNIDFTLENINTDLSSFYFSSTQFIPIQIASNNFKSFGLTLNQEKPPQIITPNIDEVSTYDNVGNDK